jgi:hypothetical protein
METRRRVFIEFPFLFVVIVIGFVIPVLEIVFGQTGYFTHPPPPKW